MATETNNLELDVLVGLRELLRRLEYRELTVQQGDAGVTSQEIAALRREIEQLERTFVHLSAQG